MNAPIEAGVTQAENTAETEVVVAWKGFDKDLKCRDFQYEIGATYEHEGRVQACEGGFHACENPLDVWGYYPVHESRFCKVTLSGELSRHADDSKIAGAKITLNAEVGIPGIVTAAVQYMLGLVKDSLTSTSKLDTTTESDNGAYYAQIGSSGDSARIGSSGYYAQIGSSGDYARIGSSGDSARIGSSGYYAQIGSSGDSARIGSSGDSARIGSSGDSARIGSSGDSARIGSSGYSARIGSSGYSAQIDAAGKDAVIACAGIDSHAKAGENGALCLTWRDGNGRARFAVGYVGEDLKADTWYRVNEIGQLVEVTV